MNTDIIEGKWKQVIGKAKTAWGDLTDDDLKKAEGGKDQLIGVIQERYGKTKDDASKTVDSFLEKNKF